MYSKVFVTNALSCSARPFFGSCHVGGDRLGGLPGALGDGNIAKVEGLAIQA